VADDSWLPRGTRSFFLLCGREQPDRRHIAFIADWDVRGDRDAGEIRAAGSGSDQDGEHVPVRHPVDQSDGVLFSWIDRPDSAEPRDCAAGVADGDRGGVFRGLHNVFEFWMGNGEDARGRGVAVGHGVRGGERGVWFAAFGCGDTVGEPVLGARDDTPDI
jgi:hypothetical protein